MDKNSKIFIAGKRGMVGSAIYRKLIENNYLNIIGPTSKELNLLDIIEVDKFFEKEKPEIVILSAAKVGGIQANIAEPATFLYENLQIQNNVIHTAYKNGVKKLLFLSSSCVYPRLCNQPMKEEYLLSGKLEPTNEGYAVAKIAGMKMCEYYSSQYNVDYKSIMPCNVYGIGDNFSPEKSHVVGGLIRKFHIAKISNSPFVEVWGTGNARREFIFSEDLGDAALFVLENLELKDFINVGSGYDVSIKELAEIIKDVVGFKGEIMFNSKYPDGMPQKLLDVSKLDGLGWRSSTRLKEGLKQTYIHFLEDYK